MTTQHNRRRNSKGIGGHSRPYGGFTDEWLTPPEILKAIGPFDLDPCAPASRPWDVAPRYFTKEVDGLSQEWDGRVFMNPPYGPQTGQWLEKLAKHGNGIALVFARTETKMFHAWGWAMASAMLFLRGRLHFHDAQGIRAPFNAGAPSVLIAYGRGCARRLRECRIDGHFVWLRPELALAAPAARGGERA